MSDPIQVRPEIQSVRVPKASHVGPDYNINLLNGWHTRLIYSYYGQPILDYDADANEKLLYWDGPEIIGILANQNAPIIRQLFDYENSLDPQIKIQRGRNQFDPGYFSTGKLLRMKGRFLVKPAGTDTGNQYFNMDINVINDENVKIIGSQFYGLNDVRIGADSGNTYNEPTPIDFEVIISSMIAHYDDKGGAKQLIMRADGEYRMHLSPSAGIDGRFISVPIGPIQTVTGFGSWKVIEDVSTIERSNTIDFTIGGLDQMDNLFINYLIIEELG
jgi:hypothetical protein